MHYFLIFLIYPKKKRLVNIIFIILWNENGKIQRHLTLQGQPHQPGPVMKENKKSPVDKQQGF
jgi:hypothetical protein